MEIEPHELRYLISAITDMVTETTMRRVFHELGLKPDRINERQAKKRFPAAELKAWETAKLFEWQPGTGKTSPKTVPLSKLLKIEASQNIHRHLIIAARDKGK
jgi:hypothetical protein